MSTFDLWISKLLVIDLSRFWDIHDTNLHVNMICGIFRRGESRSCDHSDDKGAALHSDSAEQTYLRWPDFGRGDAHIDSGGGGGGGNPQQMQMYSTTIA